MKSAFRGYHPPTNSEMRELWKSGLIVLDTNALLHLFRYSESSRDELLELLKKYQDRIWMPHQVGSEFHRIRLSVPVKEHESFAHVESVLQSSRARILQSLDALERPALEAARIEKLAKKHLKKIERGLRKIKKDHVDAVLSKEAHARTFAIVSTLYEGRVGPAFDDARVKQTATLGAERYKRKVPPGYADQSKDESRKYGDLVLWLQMLDEGRARSLPMLFITDDLKVDWWDLSGGGPSGPRAELVEEYYQAADKRVHFLTPRDFLAEAKDRGEKISDATVEEARKVTRSGSAYAALLGNTGRGLADLIAGNAAATMMDALRAQTISPSSRSVADILGLSNNPGVLELNRTMSGLRGVNETINRIGAPYTDNTLRAQLERDERLRSWMLSRDPHGVMHSSVLASEYWRLMAHQNEERARHLAPEAEPEILDGESVPDDGDAERTEA